MKQAGFRYPRTSCVLALSKIIKIYLSIKIYYHYFLMVQSE